jgi:hypothetical protein
MVSMRRSPAVAFALLAFCSGCEKSAQPPAAGQPSAPKPATPVAAAPAPAAPESPAAKENDPVIQKAIEEVSKHHITQIPSRCLTYVLDHTTEDSWFVEVRENHVPAGCGGGEPGQAPRLFGLRISRVTGEVATDAGTTKKNYQPLPRR